MANTNITYRAGKDSALTFSEMDQNFASFFYSASAYQDGNGFNRLRLHYPGHSCITGDFDAGRCLDVLLPDAQGGITGAETGGSDKHIQFNDGGSLAGDPEFIFDKTTNRVSIGQNTFDSSLTVKGLTPDAGSVIKINSNNANDATSQSYLDISKSNNTRLKIGLVGNGQSAIPTIQASTDASGFAGGLEVALGGNKHIKVGTNGTTIGVGASLSAPNKALTVIGQMGIGNGVTTAAQSTFLSLSGDNFDGTLANYLPTNAGTAGLLITTPYSPTTGGNIAVGINKASGANETFSIFSGANNTFNSIIATFKADGNVGINQRNPKEKLHVEGNISGSGNIYVKCKATIQDIPELSSLSIDWDSSAEEYARTLVASSTGLVQYMDAAPVPKGGIIMWSGAVDNVPTGWRLCDGTDENGVTVPDLRERFIVGAGGDNTTNPVDGDPYNVGDVGGNRNAVLIAHEHSLTINQNNHGHAFKTSHENSGAKDSNGFPGIDASPPLVVHCANTGVPSQMLSNGGGNAIGGAKADILSTSKADKIGYTASGACSTKQTGINANLPPYYALAFIIYVGKA